MKNAPDFVIYVVMVKHPSSAKFDPYWEGFASVHGVHAKGFALKRDAVRECRVCRVKYGNAYVQQYGPYS